MGQQLKKGDVFFLGKGNRVMHKNYSTIVGQVYERKAIDFSEKRVSLYTLIADILLKKGVDHDFDVVKRFVNYVAKDQPATTSLFPEGHFVVTHVDSSGETNHENVYCKRLNPEAGQEADEIDFMQNKWGVGDNPYNALMHLPPDKY
ncbi:hypothetical protein LZD49_12525 [Dyadobacter sp. CY261]|uniref:hypothetical protein n=1 Tax=Dyadobacter sp. CY261 TaxID=2907203 RepID=UPI001F1E5E0E|nr:hypothetical protein [Dyadobacter sp. CY261]MCF0071298.1 hypothetical protein [Dyadobacter sp. CY261]